MYAVQQPRRYGSKALAKSTALFVAYKPPHCKQRFVYACFGNRSHYNSDTGACIHYEVQAEKLSDWYRSRTYYLPFGDNDESLKPVKLCVTSRIS